MRRLKTVLHVHTHYSTDSNNSPARILAAAARESVDCVAITDHDEIRGAQELARGGELHVIVGEEITTADGHLIGLFLEEYIPPGLPAARTAEMIRQQGGLVLAPHPFVSVGHCSVGAALRPMLPLVDAIEVCNALNPFRWQDAVAARFAQRHGLVPFVGADSHLNGRLGPCYQWLTPFDGPRSFLESLRHAQLVRGRQSPLCIAQMVWWDIADRLLGYRPATFGAGRRTTAVDAPPADAEDLAACNQRSPR